VTPFRYYLRVRYIECDAQRVVFNSRYAEYVDVSVTEFIRAAGVLHEFVDGDLDFQLVKQTVEWKAPARYDQVLELSVTPKHLGNTSFTLLTEFRIVDPSGRDPALSELRTDRRDAEEGRVEGRIIVTVETIYVLVDAKTLTKMPLPDRIRAALQSGASGQQTDHAAVGSRLSALSRELTADS
jgi:acyl-CoA thioester hydrolase